MHADFSFAPYDQSPDNWFYSLVICKFFHQYPTRSFPVQTLQRLICHMDDQNVPSVYFMVDDFTIKSWRNQHIYLLTFIFQQTKKPSKFIAERYYKLIDVILTP